MESCSSSARARRIQCKENKSPLRIRQSNGAASNPFAPLAVRAGTADVGGAPEASLPLKVAPLKVLPSRR